MTTILITEDEQVVAEDLRITLEGFGYSVAGIVATGEGAIETAERARPDLVMMDIYLAGTMTGIEAAREIRSRLDIPVIFLTAYSDSEIIEEVRKTGPYGYLLKPFNEQEVYISIEIALFRHTMDRTLRESEQRYRLFVEHFQGIAFRLSMDLEPVFYHGALPSITGYTEEEIKAGKPSWLTLVHPDDRSLYNEEMRRTTVIPGYTGEFRFRIIHLQGTVRWIQAFVQNVVDQGDIPQFIQGSLYDVTSMIEAEERLRTLNEHLDELVKKRTADLETSNRELFLKNRALQITTAGTRAIVVAKNEPDLLAIISRIIQVSGGYRALWVGTLGEDSGILHSAGFGDICSFPDAPHPADALPPCMKQVLERDEVMVMGRTGEQCADCSWKCPGKNEHILATRLNSGTRMLGGMYALLPEHLMPEAPEITLFQQMAQEVAFVIGYLRADEREKMAIDHISRLLEQLAILNDQIRNPLQGIVGYASLATDPSSQKIIDLSLLINDIVERLDKGYLESKKVRRYLERHENISGPPPPAIGNMPRPGKRDAPDEHQGEVQDRPW